MITYFTGVPGSGKTYSAVDTIYNNFFNHDYYKKESKKELICPTNSAAKLDMLKYYFKGFLSRFSSKKTKKSRRAFKKQYASCFTNINDFKFERCNNVHYLDIDVIDEQIKELHSMYKKKKSDDEINEKCKEYNIYSTLFVFDEAQNFFDTQKAHLVWWLTYHRHMYHDIILITQNLALINVKYKNLAEEFYKARPKSLSFNPKNFTYQKFIDAKMTRASNAGVRTVLKRQAVFGLYQSGDSVETKNILLKYVLIASAFAFVVVSGFMLFISSFAPDPVETNTSIEENITNAAPTSIVNSVTATNLIKDHVPTTVNYSSEDKYISITCFSNKCLYESTHFPYEVLLYLVETYDVKVIHKISDNRHVEIHLLASSAFIELFKKGEKKDDKKSSFMPTSGSLFGK